MGNAKAGPRGDQCNVERCIYLTREASGYHSPALRLGLLYSLVLKTAPQIVQGLKKRRPELSIEFIMNSNKKLLEALNEGNIDCGINLYAR